MQINQSARTTFIFRSSRQLPTAAPTLAPQSGKGRSLAEGREQNGAAARREAAHGGGTATAAPWSQAPPHRQGCCPVSACKATVIPDPLHNFSF